MILIDLNFNAIFEAYTSIIDISVIFLETSSQYCTLLLCRTRNINTLDYKPWLLTATWQQ